MSRQAARAGWRREKRKWKPGTEKLMMQRHVKARYHSMMAPEGQQRVDELTVLAVTGRLRSSLLSHVQYLFLV